MADDEKSCTFDPHYILVILKTLSNPTCSASGPKCPGLRRCVDPSEHSHPLCGAAVEVVVVGDGGDPEAGVMLWRGVGPIAVPRVVREAGLPVISEFRCFFILTLDTAHSLLSAGGEKERETKLDHRLTSRLHWGNSDSIFHYFRLSSESYTKPCEKSFN